MEHYFSAQPATPDERREISVSLDGRRVTLETAPGVFSPDHIDVGTTLLLETVDTPPTGSLLDLGCGWGPIALTAALRQPDVTVTAVDINERSLDLLARNIERAKALGPMGSIVPCLPGDVDADLSFDALWSNPPIRIGKQALHDMMTMWLPRLVPDGEAWLVVNKNLGADSLAQWISAQRDAHGAPWGGVDKVRSSKGFRILRFTRA